APPERNLPVGTSADELAAGGADPEIPGSIFGDFGYEPSVWRWRRAVPMRNEDATRGAVPDFDPIQAVQRSRPDLAGTGLQQRGFESGRVSHRILRAVERNIGEGHALRSRLPAAGVKAEQTHRRYDPVRAVPRVQQIMNRTGGETVGGGVVRELLAVEKGKPL